MALFYCFVALSVLAFPVSAQFETAEVLGTVHDATGAVLPKAAILLLNEETAIESKTTSDESGAYDFFNVRLGRYTITAELEGVDSKSISS